MEFAVVLFTDEDNAPAIIASNWMNQTKTKCFYPNVKSDLKKSKLLIAREPPSNNWLQSPIIVLEECADYKTAKWLLRIAENRSKFESDDECNNSRKRKKDTIELPEEQSLNEEVENHTGSTISDLHPTPSHITFEMKPAISNGVLLNPTTTHDSVNQNCQEQNVDGEDLMAITNEDLKELGMKLGNRKKILSFIKNERLEGITYEVIPLVETEMNSPAESISCPVLEKENEKSQPSIPYEFNNKYTQPETIPVLEAVKASERGKSILKNLEKGKIVSQNDVREIVRLVLAMAVRDLQTFYPSYDVKVNLAKAIVLGIPQLKGTRDGCEGYEQFFDPYLRVGMIEWRLKTMRLALSPSRKKNKKRKTPIAEDKEDEVMVDDLDIENKITWLKYKTPSELHKNEIFESMADTFKARRLFVVKDTPSITIVLEKFPKLKEYQGELIDVEFSTMYPEAGSLLGEFPLNYMPKVVKYCKEKKLDVYVRYEEILDENLAACLMLADLLPRTGLRRKLFPENKQKSNSGKYPSEYIIQFPGENVDMKEVISKSLGSQPSLICQGDRTTGECQYFMKLDNQVIDVGHSAIKALDLLYKSHYAFNVEYHNACEGFYLFLDFIIYKIKTGASKSSIENLNLLLNRVNV